MNEYYYGVIGEIVEDYVLYHNRDRMMSRCQTLANDCDVDVTEVVSDVDELYILEFGDLYETA